MTKQSLYPLFPKQYNFGKRSHTFQKTFELLEERNAKNLLETGTARYGLKKCKSDGASTLVFGRWAKLHDARLWSIDHDPRAIKIALWQAEKAALDEFITFIHCDSIKYLRMFDKPVDLLYLDSFDYHKRDKTQQMMCQQHHLSEFKAVENRLHAKSVVLIDDCDLPNGGKGKLVINYMLKNDWQLVMKSYQSLLIKAG